MACVLLTSCTNRKRSVPDERLQCSSLPRGDLATAAETWSQRLSSVQRVIAAEALLVEAEMIRRAAVTFSADPDTPSSSGYPQVRG
jgi:hypothetical protein